jgi:hypothetical protein
MTPDPEFAAYFGQAVDAVGDKVLIGSPGSTSEPRGAAYLFTTNGSLLTIFTNQPSDEKGFGTAVAGIGYNKVIVSSSGDLIMGVSAGAAHLFSTNGTPLGKLENPSPHLYDSFSSSLAAVGSDSALIGAVWHDEPGAVDTGVAYIFRLRPTLLITGDNTTVIISWPSAWTGWNIQETTDLLSGSWTSPPQTIQVNATIKFITVNASSARFYRLIYQ